MAIIWWDEFGATRAEAIVDGRPYHAKDERVRRKLLPQTVYDQVEGLVIVK